MSGINKVMLIGHLGKDPDLRVINGETQIVSFPLVTAEYFTRNGIKTEQAEWHNIIMWRSTAENASKILKKGRLIYIEGTLRTRSFEDKTGLRKYITEVIADSFKILGRSSDFEETIAL